MNTDASPLSFEEARQRALHVQRKLHEWASQDAERRFQDLWNLVCDPATLIVAWSRVSQNRGSRTAGINGKTYVEQNIGVAQFLTDLRGELKSGEFRPLAVRERLIPKTRWPDASPRDPDAQRPRRADGGYAVTNLGLEIEQLPPAAARSTTAALSVAAARAPLLDWTVGQINRRTVGRPTARAVDLYNAALNRLLLLAPESLLQTAVAVAQTTLQSGASICDGAARPGWGPIRHLHGTGPTYRADSGGHLPQLFAQRLWPALRNSHRGSDQRACAARRHPRRGMGGAVV